MTYTYDPSLAEDKDTIRFRIGDTDTARAFLHDEEIAALLTANDDDLNATEVNCLDSIANRLARPDFRVDWLSVSQQVAAAEYFRRQADRKRKEYDIDGPGTLTSTTNDVVRSDTYWGDDDNITESQF